MIRLEYDRVAVYHPYRTDHPSEVPGSVRILHLDGVNGDPEECMVIQRQIASLERCLLEDGSHDLGRELRPDNHYGFTVVQEHKAQPSPGGEVVVQRTYTHVRFSDGSLYVWLMPQGWEVSK